MTTYTLDIGGNEYDFTKIVINFFNGPNPCPWNAILEDVSAAVSKGDAVTISRDGTTIFQGVMEAKDPQMGPEGTFLFVSGRHTKVKLWRKWAERYSEKGGFFSNYYMNKIVGFLLRPSFSDKPEWNDSYKRIGTGLDPRTWTVSTSVTEDTGRDVEHITNRLNIVGFRSVGTQALNNTITIDLGSGNAKKLIAIRVDNRTLRPEEFARNYIIEAANVGDFSSHVDVISAVTNNRAINILESWNEPGTAYRYWRIRLTANFGRNWSVSNIYLYETDVVISGISVGTLTEHLPLNVSLATEDIATEIDIDVTDGWKFKEGDDVLIGDDNGDETGTVASVSGDTVTLTGATSGSYTMANNAFMLNLDATSELNYDYLRRTDIIDRIVSMCKESDDSMWTWEVTNAGVVNMGAQVGTDLSGSIAFVLADEILKASAKDDDSVRVDRIKVLGKGKGDKQDQISSDWIGSGNYEYVHIDTSLETVEACTQKAYELLNQYSTGKQSEMITVRDTYTTNAWGVDDDVTITESLTGLSGSYLIKKIVRTYGPKTGEIVRIETTHGRTTSANLVAGIMKRISDGTQKQDDYGEDSSVESDKFVGDRRYIYKYEAENLILDPDVTTTLDSSVSGNNYITMGSAQSGDVVLGGGGMALEPGQWVVIFKCKVASNVSSDDLVTLRMYSADYGGNIDSKTIKPSDFSANDTWNMITFAIGLNTRYNDVEIKIDSFQTGITDFSCDFVSITSVFIMDFPAGPPSAPANPSASSATTSVVVSWDENTEADFDHYIVYRDEGSPATTEYARMRLNSFMDTNVSAGITYYYRIKATDWVGNVSDYSNEVNASPGGISPGDLDIELRPYTSEISFIWDDFDDDPPTDFDHIKWGAPGGEGGGGTDADIDFADGTTVQINPGESNGVAPPNGCGSAGVVYGYWDDNFMSGGDYDIQWSTDHADAVGVGKGLLVVIGHNATKGPTILPIFSYMPTISGGYISAKTIDTIHLAAVSVTADELNVVGINASGQILLTQIGGGDLDNIDDGAVHGKVLGTQMTAGKIFLTETQYMGTQTFGLLSSVATTRVEITASYIQGLAAGVSQFYVDAADGRAYFGGGSVKLDTSGLTLQSDTFTGITFKEAGGTTRLEIEMAGGMARLWGSGASHIDFEANGAIEIISDGTLSLITTAGNDIELDPFDERSVILTNSISGENKLRPASDNRGYLGTPTYTWAEIHGYDIYGNSFSGTNATITNGYFTNLYGYRIMYVGDETVKSLVGSVETEIKTFRVIRDDSHGIKPTTLYFVGEAYVSGGTGYLKVSVNGGASQTVWTFTDGAYAHQAGSISVSLTNDTINTISIRLDNSGANTTYNRTLEVYAYCAS